MNDKLSRRYFFFGSLLAGAIPAAGFGSSASLTRLGFKSPNEKLNLAAIGAFRRVLVGIIALKYEGKIEWDAAHMRITNRQEANQLLKPKFRKNWKFA